MGVGGRRWGHQIVSKLENQSNRPVGGQVALVTVTVATRLTETVGIQPNLSVGRQVALVTVTLATRLAETVGIQPNL